MRSFIFSQYLRSLVKVPLHWVLVVPFVLQTVGAVGLVGYFSYRSGQEAVEDLAKRLLAQVSERVSDRLDRYLQTSQQIVAINHLAVKQGSLNINDFEQLQQHLWEQMKLNPSLTSNGFWSAEGEAIAYGRIFSEKERYYSSKLIGKNLTLGKNYIIKINKLNPSQRQFYRIDDRGKTTKLIYSKTDLDFRQLPWYRQAKASRKQIWSSISVNRIIPVLQIQALAPIYNNAGKFQGVFRSIYFLSDLSSFLYKQNFSRSGQVLILEHSGNLVTSSSLENIYVKQTKGQPKRLLAVNSLDTRTREIARKLINKFGSFDNLRDTKQINLVINNQQHFVQVTPYKDNYGLDWLIVIIVPQSDFMGSINENLWRTIWLCGLTFLGTTAAGIISAYYIAKPIRRLSRSSQALAAGNWQNVEQEDSAIKEISVLAQSFNCTAEQLQKSFEQIKTALQESEARFTKVFRASPDPISINQLGDGGKYLEVNDSFLQISEYSREEIVGRTTEELNFCADPQQHIIIWELFQKSGRIKGIEFRYRTKSGKLGTSLLSIELVELDGQQRVLTISKDITDRKQLELALQASQAQLNDVLNSAIAAISSFRVSPDNNWEINYISAGCEFISGYTPAELQADKNLWNSRIFPGDWEAIVSQLYADIFAQQTGTYEYRLYHKNASLRWISQTNTSRWDETLNCWIVTAVSLDITERKQVEKQLSKTEKWLHHYSNQSPSTIYTIVLELDGRFWFEYISSAVEAIHEVTQAQVLENAQVIFDQFHPDDRAGYHDAVIKSAQNLELFCHEWRIITPSGKIKWLQANCQPERRSNGAIAWHGVVLDITERQAALCERKQAEEQLSKTEQWLRHYSNLSPSSIYTLVQELDGRVWFEYHSSAVAAIHELTETQVLENAQLIFDQFHPDDIASYTEAVARSKENLALFSHEWRIITPSGKVKWLQANSQPERRSNGAIAWHGVVLDVTERKQAQEALRQSEERFQKLAAASPGVIFTVIEYPSGPVRYEYVSPAFEEIHEIPVAEVIQDATITFNQIHPGDREGYQQAVKECLRTGKPFKHEWRIITPSGKTKWIQANSRLQRRENGELAWHGVVLDISEQQAALRERKLVEEKLRKTEKWLNQFSHSSPSAIYTLVRELNGLFWFEYMSSACEAINEVTAEQALKDAYSILGQIHSEDVSGYNAAVNHSAETLELFCYQWRIITPSGKLKCLQANSQPERRSNGAIAWHGVVLDITEQKLTEQALQQALQHIDTHFDECPLAIMQWDRDFQILRWSKQAERIFGWTAEEVKTLSWQGLGTEEQRSRGDGEMGRWGDGET
ncbi:PAS domain S-box protein, partial [Phormidium sp. LEGE 05292]|uniref:PAS domain S-box protein n=1 Tax=[Phormidium] sp. LEGE 05292 TaxID=767427 RepID=UPI00188065D1